MASLTCLDGRELTVEVEPVLARDGVPYEAVLRLLLDGVVFAEVGERCAWQLAEVLDRLRTGSASALEAAVRAWAGAEDAEAVWASLAPRLPPDQPLLALRRRTRDDLPGTGELRVALRTDRDWVDGSWQARERAVVDAGDGTTSVRAEVDRAGLAEFLQALVSQAQRLGALDAAVALEVPGAPADH